MFRDIRRVKNKISDEQAKDLLRFCRRAALSMNGDDGYPYCIPINFYYEESENRVYFHSSKAGHKIDSITANSKICLTVWGNEYLEDGDWAYHVSSCVVFGRASIVEDADIKEAKMRKFALKYYPSAEEVEEVLASDLHHANLIAIDIEHLSGKQVQEK